MGEGGKALKKFYIIPLTLLWFPILQSVGKLSQHVPASHDFSFPNALENNYHLIFKNKFKPLTYHPHEEVYHLYLMLVAMPLFHVSFSLFFLFLREFAWNSELLPLFLVFQAHYSELSEINEFKTASINFSPKKS